MQVYNILKEIVNKHGMIAEKTLHELAIAKNKEVNGFEISSGQLDGLLSVLIRDKELVAVEYDFALDPNTTFEEKAIHCAMQGLEFGVKDGKTYATDWLHNTIYFPIGTKIRTINAVEPAMDWMEKYVGVPDTHELKPGEAVCLGNSKL